MHTTVSLNCFQHNCLFNLFIDCLGLGCDFIITFITLVLIVFRSYTFLQKLVDRVRAQQAFVMSVQCVVHDSEYNLYNGCQEQGWGNVFWFIRGLGW